MRPGFTYDAGRTIFGLIMDVCANAATLDRSSDPNAVRLANEIDSSATALQTFMQETLNVSDDERERFERDWIELEAR